MIQGSGELAAVLFDMDGTLVDSEKVWQVALDQLAAEMGGVMSESVRKAMVGSTTPRAIAMLHEDIGVTGRDVQADSDALEDRMMSLCAGQLDFRPGAFELLQRGPRGRLQDRAGHRDRSPDRRGHARHDRPGQLRRGDHA